MVFPCFASPVQLAGVKGKGKEEVVSKRAIGKSDTDRPLGNLQGSGRGLPAKRSPFFLSTEQQIRSQAKTCFMRIYS